MSAENKFLLRKVMVAFIVSFSGALITSWQGLSKEPDFKFTNALLISVVVGALSAAVRATLAVLPTNLVPSDAQHTLIGKSLTQKDEPPDEPVEKPVVPGDPIPHPIDPQITPPPQVPAPTPVPTEPPKKSRKGKRRKK